MDAVTVDGLDVTRGGRPVLRDFSLRVPAGRLTGLLGPSGCGKSTLMRAIVGVQREDGGDVTVLERPAGHPALRRELGYVTQATSPAGAPRRRAKWCRFSPTVRSAYTEGAWVT